MKYVVAYDISDDKRRLVVARTLEGFGVRVQESVFECALDDASHSLLLDRLTRDLTDCENASVRVYRLCADCHRASVAIEAGEVGRRQIGCKIL